MRVVYLLLSIVFYTSCGTSVAPEEKLSKEGAKAYQSFVKEVMEERNVSFGNFVGAVTPTAKGLTDNPAYIVDFENLELLLKKAKEGNKKALVKFEEMKEVNSEFAYKPVLLELLNASQGFLLGFENWFIVLKKEQTETSIKDGYTSVYNAGAIIQEKQKLYNTAQDKFIEEYKLALE